jgi:predicted DNA-binding protein
MGEATVEPKVRGLFVRMTEPEHKRLRVAAAERGRPIAELVREAIKRYLETLERDNG